MENSLGIDIMPMFNGHTHIDNQLPCRVLRIKLTVNFGYQERNRDYRLERKLLWSKKVCRRSNHFASAYNSSCSVCVRERVACRSCADFHCYKFCVKYGCSSISCLCSYEAAPTNFLCIVSASSKFTYTTLVVRFLHCIFFSHLVISSKCTTAKH